MERDVFVIEDDKEIFCHTEKEEDGNIEITRNDGTVIRLSELEAECIYDIVRNKHVASDIQNYFDEEYDEGCPFSDDQLLQMGEDVYEYLANDDDYHDSYNNAMLAVIDVTIKMGV